MPAGHLQGQPIDRVLGQFGAQPLHLFCGGGAVFADGDGGLDDRGLAVITRERA